MYIFKDRMWAWQLRRLSVWAYHYMVELGDKQVLTLARSWFHTLKVAKRRRETWCQLYVALRDISFYYNRLGFSRGMKSAPAVQLSSEPQISLPRFLSFLALKLRTDRLSHPFTLRLTWTSTHMGGSPCGGPGVCWYRRSVSIFLRTVSASNVRVIAYSCDSSMVMLGNFMEIDYRRAAVRS